MLLVLTEEYFLIVRRDRVQNKNFASSFKSGTCLVNNGDIKTLRNIKTHLLLVLIVE